MPRTPEQEAADWAEGLKNAKKKYITGIQEVTESPMEMATTPEAERKFLKSIKESVESGRRRNALRRRTLSEWKQLASTKGANRLEDGANAGKAKFAAYVALAKPIRDAVSAEVQAMPSETEADAEARAIAAIRGMRKLKGIMQQ